MGEKKLNDRYLATFKGLAVNARLRPFLASLILHLGLVMGLLAGGPLGPSWKRLEVASGDLEVQFLSSPSKVSSVHSAVPHAVPHAREVKPLPTKLVVDPSLTARSLDDVANGEKLPEENTGPESEPGNSQASAGNSSKAESLGSKSAEALYLAEIRTLLDSKKDYPIAARRMGHRGRVVVRFVLERDGRVQKAEIVEGSSSEILNRAARSLIDGLRAVKPFPKEVALSEWAVVVPIEYQM